MRACTLRPGTGPRFFVSAHVQSRSFEVQGPHLGSCVCCIDSQFSLHWSEAQSVGQSSSVKATHLAIAFYAFLAAHVARLCDSASLLSALSSTACIISFVVTIAVAWPCVRRARRGAPICISHLLASTWMVYGHSIRVGCLMD